jgi:DNA-binding Lrp family transcriptional regulator
MVKNTKEHILKDEIKLLTELQKNSNEKLDIIAHRCGFSRQKAWRLIKLLEKNKSIWGYTAICDDEKMGLIHFIFIAKRTSNKIDEKIIETIISRKLETAAAELGIIVENSYYIHGEYDWILTATGKDIIDAKRFSDLLMKQYPNIFQSITIMQTMFVIKKQYVLNPEREKLRKLL